MTAGLIMVGSAVLLVYLFATGQLAALIKVVTDAAKGTHLAPLEAASRRGGGDALVAP